MPRQCLGHALGRLLHRAGARERASRVLRVEIRSAPTGGDAQLEKIDGAALVWLETPCNPGLDVCDLAKAVEAAHERGTMVAVDNTTRR